MLSTLTHVGFLPCKKELVLPFFSSFYPVNCFLLLSTEFSHVMNCLSTICFLYDKPLVSSLDEIFHTEKCSLLFSLFFFIHIIVIIMTIIIFLSPSVFPLLLRFFCYTSFLTRNLFYSADLSSLFSYCLIFTYQVSGMGCVCAHMFQERFQAC